MAKVKKRIKSKNKNIESPFKNYWSRNNYFILIAGLITIFVGFYFMNQGPWDNPLSLTVAPIILLIAYIVIIPLAIYYRKAPKNNEHDS
jgi:purine-cytosine permease-like protein